MLGNVSPRSSPGWWCFVTLLILGVPFPFLLGLWVALVDLLPLIGGLLAGIPVVIIAAFHSLPAFIVTAVVFIVYQQVENHLLNPMVMSKTVRLNPLWVLLAVLCGASHRRQGGERPGGLRGRADRDPGGRGHPGRGPGDPPRRPQPDEGPALRSSRAGGGDAGSPKLPPVRVLVIVPTYNEAENIELVLGRIREALPEAGILVVDDGSPDGTADLAEKVAAELGDIHVLRRTAKSGLGSAYRAGFAWGLERGYDACVEMDADFSHDPAALPDLVAPLAEGYELVDRLALRARRVHPQLVAGTATCCRGAATSTPRPCSGLGVTDSTAGLPGLRRHGPAPARPRPDPGRGLRVPDRDDLPVQAGGGGHHRGAHPLRRPGGRGVQDVLGHRGRGPGPGDLVGARAGGGGRCVTWSRRPRRRWWRRRR